MATSTKAVTPAKKKQGFGGIKDAIWIMVICCIIAYCFYYFVLGDASHFVGGDKSAHPADLMGTVYKGGPVVGLIFTLFLTVVCLGVERYFALRSAFGTMNLSKFTVQVKALIKQGKFTEAQALCDKMRGSVANVVTASINAYKDVESNNTMKKRTEDSQDTAGTRGGYPAGDAYAADEPAYRCYHRYARYTYRSVRYCVGYDPFVPGPVKRRWRRLNGPVCRYF